MRFYRLDFVLGRSGPFIVVHANDYQFQTTVFIPYDTDAIDWAVDVDRDDSGGLVYVFVREYSFYGLGVRRRKTDEAYQYIW